MHIQHVLTTSIHAHAHECMAHITYHRAALVEHKHYVIALLGRNACCALGIGRLIEEIRRFAPLAFLDGLTSGSGLLMLNHSLVVSLFHFGVHVILV